MDQNFKIPPYLGPAALAAFLLLILLGVCYFELYTRCGTNWRYKYAGMAIVTLQGLIVVFVTILYGFLQPDFAIGVHFEGSHITFGNLAGTIVVCLITAGFITRYVLKLLKRRVA